MRISAALCAVLVVLGAAVAPCAAVMLDFETGLDDDPIGTISGLTFTTPGGYDVVYYGVDNTYNMVASDNGKQSNEDWQYWISGDFGAMGKQENVALITFSQQMQYFRVGYSSYFPFVVEAYDSGGNLVASDGGLRNSREWGGTGLSYVDVSYSGMSSVKLFCDMGSFPEAGYWVIDNVRADPKGGVIPEWPALALMITALPAFAWRRRR